MPRGVLAAYADPVERIADRFEITDSGCWEWSGFRDRNGYGQLGVDGTGWLAHRYSYHTLVGPIPVGLTIDHLCRNRACIHPDHLEPVTIQENLRRGESFSAKQLAQTHCKRGHLLSRENCYESQWPERRNCRQCNHLRNRQRS